MRKRIEPYSETWPRRLDLLCPLKLQAAVEPNLELLYCEAEVMMARALASDRTTTEYGTLKVNPLDAHKMHYVKGNPNPRKENIPVTQKEIFDDVQDRIPEEIPGIIIDRRITREKISDKLRELEALETSEHIFRSEISKGTHSKRDSKRFGIRLFDPYQKVKIELLSGGIVKNPYDPIFRQIRSIQRTEYIIPEDEEKGYNDLGPIGIKKIDTVMSHEKWWQAIGIPKEFKGALDHLMLQGQLFHLPKYEGEGEYIIV